MTRYRVTHRTRYRYDAPVAVSYGQSCLLPRDTDRQRCVASALTVSPTPEDVRERVDFFGNRATYFRVDETHDALEIVATSDVDVEPLPAVEAPTLGEMRSLLASLDGDERVEATHYRLPSPRVPIDDRVRRFGAASFDDAEPFADCLSDLMVRVGERFEFDAEATTVTSTLDDLFEQGAGVCQDFAHLVVACLRAEGIPARYVSGYLETLPPPGRPRLVGVDVSHAWVSAKVPGTGWLDLDPTNRQFVDERYVTTGWGRDYDDVPPLKGVIYSDSVRTKLTVSVDVARVD